MQDFFDELNSELWDKNSDSQKENTENKNNVSEDINDNSKVNIPLTFDPSKSNPHVKTKYRFNQNTTNNNHSNNNTNNSNYNNSNGKSFMSIKDTMQNNFPQTRFYLPLLREESTRVVYVGWNNEVGKNMTVYQYEDDLIIVDGGLQKNHSGVLQKKYSIPDISFLIPIKEKIKWFFVTNGLIDNAGALSQILGPLWYPKVFWNEITIGLLKVLIKDQEVLKNTEFVVLKDGETITCPDCKFKVTPISSSDTPSLTMYNIVSPNLNIMHTWSYKITDDLKTKLADYKWVNLLVNESSSSFKKGPFYSKYSIDENLRKILRNKKARTFVLTPYPLITRLAPILEEADKLNKSVFALWKDLTDVIEFGESMGLFEKWKVKKYNPNLVENLDATDQVILVSGNIDEKFSEISKIIDWSNYNIAFERWDSLIVPPYELQNDASLRILNRLFFDGINIITNTFLDPRQASIAGKEETQELIKILNPDSIAPYGTHSLHRNVAQVWIIETGFAKENITQCNNWEMIDVDKTGNVFKSRIRVPVQEILVDGYGIGLATSHIIKARERMMDGWVIVAIFPVDSNTRTIVWPMRLETRWFVYLDEVRLMHKVLIKKARSVFEMTLQDVPEIEDKDLIKIIKTDLESYILKTVNREPMVIPVIVNM